MQITCPTCRNTFEAVTRRASCEHCGTQIDVWAILSGHTGPLPEARNAVLTGDPATAARAGEEPSSGASDRFSTTFVPASESVLDLPLTEIVPERSLELEPVLDASFSALPGEFVRAVALPPLNSEDTSEATAGGSPLAVLTGEPGEHNRVNRAAWVVGVGALFIAAIAGTYYICEATHRGDANSQIATTTQTGRPPTAIPEPSPALVLSASEVKASPSANVEAPKAKLAETQPLVSPTAATRAAPSPNDATTAESATRARAVNPLAVGAGKYTLQIAAKPTEAEARQLADKLIDAGLDARIIKASVPVAGTGEVKTWYRVRVGAFGTKADATQYGEQLKRGRSIEDYFIADLRK